MRLQTCSEPPADPQVDIVAIHGLNGGPVATWTHANGSNWLTDGGFLSAKVENARIFSFGYNAEVNLSGKNIGDMRTCAGGLLAGLVDQRDSEAAKYRPLIFVAHSLGGLILKETLIMSAWSALSDEKAIQSSTIGIIFLGVPHKGSDFANHANRLLAIPWADMNTPPHHLLRGLLEGNHQLAHLAANFRQLQDSYKIVSFFETVAMPPFASPIVNQASALLNSAHEVQIPIDATHVNICKYESPEDYNFGLVHRRINRILREFMNRRAAQATTQAGNQGGNSGHGAGGQAEREGSSHGGNQRGDQGGNQGDGQGGGQAGSRLGYQGGPQAGQRQGLSHLAIQGKEMGPTPPLSVKPLPAVDWMRIGERTTFSPALNFSSKEYELTFREGALVWKKELGTGGDISNWALNASPELWHGTLGQGQSCRVVIEMIVLEVGRTINGAGAELLIHENGEDFSLFFTVSAGANGPILKVASRYGMSHMVSHDEPAPGEANAPGARIKLEMQYIRSRGTQDATVFFLCNGRQLDYVWSAPTGPGVTVAPRLAVAGIGEFKFLS